MLCRSPTSTLFPYTTLFRSVVSETGFGNIHIMAILSDANAVGSMNSVVQNPERHYLNHRVDRKSTRLNSSHLGISYAVFCLKKKKKKENKQKKTTTNIHNLI